MLRLQPDLKAVEIDEAFSCLQLPQARREIGEMLA
jgi:hypothetical protein